MKKALQVIIALFALAVLATMSFAQREPKVVPGQILVRVAPGTSESAVHALAQRHECELLKSLALDRWYVLGRKDRDRASREEPLTDKLRQTINAIAQEPGVIAEANWLFHMTRQGNATTVPNDTHYNRQLWHYEMIRMPEAWAIQDGDPSVRIRVGVVDSGMNVGHEDFTENGRNRIVAQADFTGSGNTNDIDGHGTHVGGTIGAVGNNGQGVTGVAGWEKNGVVVEIVSAKVFNGGGSGLDIITNGFRYVVDQGARVVNLSLGGNLAGPPPRIFEDAVNYARSRGVIVVAGAGNGDENGVGIDNDGPVKFYPADIPGVLKVGAVYTDRKKTLYSNFGGPMFITAPGGDGPGNGPDDIWSTAPFPSSIDIPQPLPGGYGGISGTSMACPHVAGVITLLLAAGVTTEQEVRSILTSTAQTPADGPDPKRYGAGIVDAYSALLQVVNPAPTLKLDGTSLSATGTIPMSDRGVTYFKPVGIRVRLRGVSNMVSGSGALTGKQIRQSDVKVEVFRVGSTTPVAPSPYIGGRDFLIPQLRPNDRKSKEFVVDVPSNASDPTALPTDPGVKLPPAPLSPGSYKIVTSVAGVVTSVQFVTVAEKELPAGRSMFALPFRADLASGPLSKERLMLGANVTFGLARYNPTRLPSEEDYARFRSDNTIADVASRFVIGNVGGAPLTYDTADPAAGIGPIGVGYWLDLDQPTKVDTGRLTDGRLDTAGLDVSNAVGIRVFATGGGWNMIGAPFAYPVEWSSVTVQVGGVAYSLAEAVANGFISPALVGYDTDRRDYSYAIAPNGQLQPFQAYWVRVYRDAVIIVPPRQSGVSRASSLPTRLEGWRARLSASVGGDVDGQNYFGQLRDATDGADLQDVAKPPAGSGNVYVRFESKGVEGKTRALAFDMRGASSLERQEWRAAVTSLRPGADVTLTWDGLRSVPRRYRVSLRDEATGQSVSMQGRASYTYKSGEAGATRYFKITLEPQASAGALIFTNIRPSATREGSGVAVRFTLNQEAEVIGSIKTLSGRTVASLTGASRAQAGSETTLRWSGRAQDGSPIPAGAYILEVTARGADGTPAKFTRTIQHLR